MLGQIERIRIFITVAELRSFAAAARRLHASPSALTRAVAELESELGVQLLLRTTRSVSLTMAGSIYLERVRNLPVELERANALVREQQNIMKGALRLSVPLSLGLRFLPDVIAQFRILYPDIELNVDMADRFVDILSEDYDMALRISGPPEDKSTIWRKICSVPRVLVASPDYLARKGIPATPKDLEAHDFLRYSHFSGGDELELTEESSGRRQSVRTHHVFACNNGDMLAEMAIRHEGIVLLPRFIVDQAVLAGTLIPVLGSWAAPPIWLTAFYPPYATLPVKVERLTHFIEAAVSVNTTLFDVRKV